MGRPPWVPLPCAAAAVAAAAPLAPSATSTAATPTELASALPATGRLRRLDGVRGMAMLLVLVIHCWRPERTTGLGRWISHLAVAGWSGVDLFFVLSGFLITGILVDSRGRPGWLRRFFARRVLRIFPLYYLFLAVSLLLLPAYVARIHFGQVPRYGYAADAAAWPWYVSYLSNVWMALHGHFSTGFANSVTWSLAIEEQFYLAWPLLILLCPPRYLVALVGALFGAAVAVRLGLALTGSGWLSFYVLLPCRMDALAAGAFIALWTRSPSFRPRAWQALSRMACWLLLPAVLAWIVIAPDDVRRSAAFQVAGYSLLALGWAGLLARVLAGSARRAWEAAPLVSLGKYSYGIYLFHPVLLGVVMPLAYRSVIAWLGNQLAERFFWFAAGVAGSWLLAAALYHLYEIHFLRLKRRFEDGGAVVLPATATPRAAAPPAAPADPPPRLAVDGGSGSLAG